MCAVGCALQFVFIALAVVCLERRTVETSPAASLHETAHGDHCSSWQSIADEYLRVSQAWSDVLPAFDAGHDRLDTLRGSITRELIPLAPLVSLVLMEKSNRSPRISTQDRDQITLGIDCEIGSIKMQVRRLQHGLRTLQQRSALRPDTAQVLDHMQHWLNCVADYPTPLWDRCQLAIVHAEHSSPSFRRF
jgi:hypothetical protein